MLKGFKLSLFTEQNGFTLADVEDSDSEDEVCETDAGPRVIPRLNQDWKHLELDSCQGIKFNHHQLITQASLVHYIISSSHNHHQLITSLSGAGLVPTYLRLSAHHRINHFQHIRILGLKPQFPFSGFTFFYLNELFLSIYLFSFYSSHMC